MANLLTTTELISELWDQAEVIGPGTECNLLKLAAERLACRLEELDERVDIMQTEHEAELKSASTVGGWISVKDRLPESSGIKVLVSAKTVPDNVLQTKAVFVAFLGYGDWKWYTPDVDFMTSAKTGNDHVHPVWEITHWMFLPEPQKGENDGTACEN